MRLLIIFFLYFSFNAFAQKDTIHTIADEDLKISNEEIKDVNNKESIHIFKDRISDVYSEFNYSFPDSLLDGIWLCFYNEDTTQIAVSLIYKNKVLNGISQGYYIDGSVKFVNTYKNGQLNGFSLFFHRDIDFYGIGNYRDGLRIGQWKYYFPNGNIMLNEFYNKKGELEGKSTMFNDKGEKSNESYYNNGIIEKKILWNRKNNTTAIIYYDNGKKVKLKNYKKLLR